MSVRYVSAVAGAALSGAFRLAVPAAAHVSLQLAPVGSYTLTAGRVWSMVAVLAGLVGVVAGGLALARSTGRIGPGPGPGPGAGAGSGPGAGSGSGPGSGSVFGSGRRGAVVALVAGLVGVVIGGLVVAAADGGPGTGYGIVGGFAALVVGVAGTALGGLALARSRRAG
ncbi:DUF6223 family protein [Streptosporangium sp. NPDC002524]|uniref:DUF6223 family protein n=1 Tax=Streptosporangium sp. NPDC002524 TaxID=3154537 RepID=UPI0033321402